MQILTYFVNAELNNEFMKLMHISLDNSSFCRPFSLVSSGEPFRDSFCPLAQP